MPGPTPHYPPEFKREAVGLYRISGKSILKMAEDVGIDSESLRRWIRQQGSIPVIAKGSLPMNMKS